MLPAAAQQAPRSPNDRINIACIGYGIMGQVDMQTASSIPGNQVVAVRDIYNGRLTARPRAVWRGYLTSPAISREILARRDGGMR